MHQGWALADLLIMRESNATWRLDSGVYTPLIGVTMIVKPYSSTSAGSWKHRLHCQMRHLAVDPLGFAHGSWMMVYASIARESTHDLPRPVGATIMMSRSLTADMQISS